MRLRILFLVRHAQPLKAGYAEVALVGEVLGDGVRASFVTAFVEDKRWIYAEVQACCVGPSDRHHLLCLVARILSDLIGAQLSSLVGRGDGEVARFVEDIARVLEPRTVDPDRTVLYLDAGQEASVWNAPLDHRKPDFGEETKARG